MAQQTHSLAYQEEAVTVLFCIVDDTCALQKRTVQQREVSGAGFKAVRTGAMQDPAYGLLRITFFQALR